MMRFLCLLIVALPLAANAQLSDSTWAAKKFHHQLSINATAFVKQFLSFTNPNPLNLQGSPFSAGYKFLLSNAAGTRLIGARLGAGYTENAQSGSQNINFEMNVKQSNLAARIGLEMQQKIINRWILYYGLDFVHTIESSDVTTKSSNGAMMIVSSNKEVATSNGGGPVVGLQFNLNKKISFSTEAAFYYMDGKRTTSSKSDFPNGGGQAVVPPDRTTKFKSIGFISPAFINFNIMF